MKLEDLRNREDEIRALLTDVREKLDAAVAAMERAERAREQAAAQGDRTKSEGAYRDMAPERALELEAQMSGARLAGEQRERLRREEARLIEQLEETRVGMERLGVRKNVLPTLDGIPAASPCSVRWDAMNGNGDARTCGHCKRTVVNVAMTDAARAQELIVACGRDLPLHRRADGTILARDCPAGVARRRFFARAPLVIIALMLVIGGVALALGTERVPRRGDPLPPSLEPGQFGRTPPVNPPPVVPITTTIAPATTLALHGAPSLHISDAFQTVGGSYQTTIDLTRIGESFAVKLTCSIFRATASRAKSIPAATVDAFLDAVSSHKATPSNEGGCFHTDDYPNINVTVGVTSPVTLSVHNCSYQWHANGVTLEDTPGDASSPSQRETAHAEINAAYRAMVVAAGESDCYDEARKKRDQPKRDNGPRPCDPPYTVDATGAKHWKSECF